MNDMEPTRPASHETEEARTAAMRLLHGLPDRGPPPGRMDASPAPTLADWNLAPASDIDTMVAAFNAKFMVVNEGGKAVVLKPDYDAMLERRLFTRFTFRDFRDLHSHEQIQVGVNDHGVAMKSAGDVWLKHPNRRTYLGGITFDPSGRKVDADVFNLWTGFAVQPAPGNWSLLHDHIRDILCDGNDEHFDYLLNWIARLFQFPARQGEVAVVMQGKEGTGKGTLANTLRRITGHHGLTISNSKHLTGHFNAHLRDLVFLFADEALFAGDKSQIGALNTLITDEYMTVEGKFQNAVGTRNFLHLMMASNEDWVIPAGKDARRYFVLKVSDARMRDTAYFSAIAQQLDAGGRAAMLHDLLARDLSCFDVRAVPTTEGLRDQQKQSLLTTDRWWVDCLERGYVFQSRIGLDDIFGQWLPELSMELLFSSYESFGKAHGERHLITRERLGRFLVTVGCQARRPNHGIVGEKLGDVEDIHGRTSRKAQPVIRDRPHSYSIGTLDQARASFNTQTGLGIIWDGGSVEDDKDT